MQKRHTVSQFSLFYTTSEKQTNKKLFFRFREEFSSLQLYCKVCAGEYHLLSECCCGPLIFNRRLCVCTCVCVRERDCLPLYNVSHFQMGLTSFAGNKKKKGGGGLKFNVFIFPILFTSCIQSPFRLVLSLLNCLMKVS